MLQVLQNVSLLGLR